MKDHKRKAQTTIEYLLLVSIVAIVVLIAFKYQLPRVNTMAVNFYNKIAAGIMGEPVNSNP